MTMFNTLWLGFRASVFWLGSVISTLIVGGIMMTVLWALPDRWRYPTVTLWNRFNLWWLEVTCGVKYRVLGLENIPQAGAFVVMANHQSTWETFALPCIFPQHLSWVLKQELLKIPFFGWGLRLLKPIGIDRSAGSAAMKQMAQEGKALIEAGISIAMFPEGTRVAVDEKVPFKIGGALMATQNGATVIPVAHNAGLSWPRHAWIKKPGTITVSIGAPIQAKGMKADALNQQVEQWISTERAQLPPL